MIYPNSKMFIPIYKKESGPQPGPDYSTMPLTFECTYSSTIAINKENLSYKKNDQQWTTYTPNEQISCIMGDKVSFSGTNTSIATSFVLDTGGFVVYGNPHSLINWGSLSPGCFRFLFYRCSSLQDAKNLILSSTTLTEGCYQFMFADCVCLTGAPQLPATTLADYCYREMFEECRWLEEGLSVLPATHIEPYSYYQMFKNCASLKDAPKLSATSFQDFVDDVLGCCGRMFWGCESLSSIEVQFTEWPTSRHPGGAPFDNWLNGVAANGTFKCPAGLDTTTRDASHVPQNWNVVN